MLSNGLGIVSGLCLSVAHAILNQNPHHRRLPRWLWATAGFLIAIAWWGSVSTLRDVYAMYNNFPLLASFESETELERWYFNGAIGKRVAAGATHGDRSLEITFSVNPHPSVTMIESIPDWTSAKAVEVDATLDADHVSPEVEMWINVVDRSQSEDYQDIFRKNFVLQRGQPTRLVIRRDELLMPIAGETLDLSSIEFFEFQMIEPSTPTKIRVDFVRLRL